LTRGVVFEAFHRRDRAGKLDALAVILEHRGQHTEIAVRVVLVGIAEVAGRKVKAHGSS